MFTFATKLTYSFHFLLSVIGPETISNVRSDGEEGADGDERDERRRLACAVDFV